ncbi:hypothetical protein Q7P35_007889 [Cladosporium inversicolor]
MVKVRPKKEEVVVDWFSLRSKSLGLGVTGWNHVKKLWDVMRGASSHSCGSQGDNTGTGRMRRPCCSHAPSLSIRRQRSRTNSPLVPACWQCTWVALVCCLDQDRLIVTASPTYSDTVKLPRPGTRQPAAGGTITAQKPIQGSGRDTHHVPLIDTISTPSLTIHIERISQVVCTHVHHAIRTHRRLHDARLRSSAHRLHTAALFAAEQELTWHWERGSPCTSGDSSTTNVLVYLTGMPMRTVAQSIPCLLGTRAQIADAHASHAPRYALYSMLDACPARADHEVDVTGLFVRLAPSDATSQSISACRTQLPSNRDVRRGASLANLDICNKWPDPIHTVFNFWSTYYQEEVGGKHDRGVAHRANSEQILVPLAMELRCASEYRLKEKQCEKWRQALILDRVAAKTHPQKMLPGPKGIKELMFRCNEWRHGCK